MNILVTGATGFVGGHLVEKLHQLGHRIFALVRTPAKAAFFPSGVEIIQGDLSFRGPNKWLKQLPDQIDTIIHTAGIVHSYNEESFYLVNAEATRQLIQDLSQNENLRFILISSLAARGPCERGQLPLESDEEYPVSHYGKSKLRAENYLKTAPASWKTAIIRPPMVIGPRDMAVLDIFKMVKSRNVLVPGRDGFANEYSIICVYDLVQLIVELLSFRGRDEVFFSSSGSTHTFEEIVATIAQELGVHTFKKAQIPAWVLPIAAGSLKFLSRAFPIEARLTPDKVHELKAPAWNCSDQKAREWLGFKAHYDLRETIKVTAKSYLEQGLL